MKHRITSLLLACLLLVGGLCPIATAETTLWTDAESMHGQVLNRSLVRAYGDGYEYFTYEPTTFEVYGKMGGMQLDLDGDGADEYLYVGMDSDNIASLTVFEQANGSWYAAASTVLYEATLTCNIAANDVFLKPSGDSWMIFNENWIHENSCADGAAWDFHAYMYSGETLYTLTDVWLDGTDISGDLDAWRNDSDLYAYRPELSDVASLVSTYNFDITSLYWSNMICEQDTSLTVVCRLLSVQDVSYSEVADFTAAGGSSLDGFRTAIVDCSYSGYALPEEYYLSNNQAEWESNAFSTSADSEYIIADSDVRELTRDELSVYDKDTLALIRNEILARYGYPFKKQMYIDYFGSKSWYTRNEDFTYNMLTSLEMENIELIKKLEGE